MQLIYVKTFMESAISIFQEFIGEDQIEVCEPQLHCEHHLIMGFAVIIGITGDVEGRVVLDMDETTAMNIANFVNDSEFSHAQEELVQATLQEIGNMIAGRAISVLHEVPCIFDITPPALLIGNEMAVNDLGHEIVSILIKTNLGDIDMSLMLCEED